MNISPALLILACAAIALAALALLLTCEHWRRRAPDPTDEAGA